MTDLIATKDYVEAILVEKDRALKMADDEREKAASALRGEQQRALDQAEREREKAASALRDELARAIQEGDDRLREHVANQINQIKGDLTSAEKLEMERVGGVTEKLAGVQREVNLQAFAAKEAITKAEKATEDRFESVNEFRKEARAVRESQATALAVLASSLLPRETFDTFQKAQDEWRRQVEQRMERDLGREMGSKETKSTQGVAMGLIFGAAGFLFTIISIVLVVGDVLTA